MTALDAADLVLIAGRTLGISTDAALAQMDIAAARAALAEAALAEARLPDRDPGTAIADPAAAAAASVELLRALLRHRPFPRHAQQVAMAAGLQLLSLNGWQADLNPPATAVVVVEALGSGQLTPDAVAAWLSPRLSRARRTRHVLIPAPRRRAPRPRGSLARPRRSLPGPRSLPAIRVSARRALAGALLTLTVGGVTLLAAACSRGPYLPGTSTGGVPAAGQHQATQHTDPSYAACMPSTGTGTAAYPATAGMSLLTPATVTHLSPPQALLCAMPR